MMFTADIFLINVRSISARCVNAKHVYLRLCVAVGVCARAWMCDCFSTSLHMVACVWVYVHANPGLPACVA